MRLLMLLTLIGMTSCAVVRYQSASQLGSKRAVISGFEVNFMQPPKAVVLQCKATKKASEMVCDKNYAGDKL